MATIAELDEAIAAVKDTDSELVEWDNNSLQNVTTIERDLIQERGVAYAEDVTALSAYSGDEALLVICEEVNSMFVWKPTGTPNGTTIFAATGGGTWNMIMKSASF